MFSRRWLSLLPLPIVCALGCGGGSGKGPQLHSVTGKVLFKDGQPVKGGAVQFVSTSDRSLTASGVIADDGTFRLHTVVGNERRAGAVEGTHEVQVIPLPSEDQSIPVLRVKTSELKVQPRDNDFKIEVERLK